MGKKLQNRKREQKVSPQKKQNIQDLKRLVDVNNF
jgi:hypothetical protein